VGRFQVTEQAEEDLDEIWEYISSDSPVAASALMDRLFEVFQTLADNPGAGRARSEIMAHARSFAVGSYIIFYRAIPDGVAIARVLHGARDIPDAL
jgi:toxin ParE1/3/4